MFGPEDNFIDLLVRLWEFVGESLYWAKDVTEPRPDAPSLLDIFVHPLLEGMIVLYEVPWFTVPALILSFAYIYLKDCAHEEERRKRTDDGN